MPAVAIPLAGLTVLATLIGGRVALRLSHTLPTVIALTGGVVVAVALFDVLPEGIEHVGDTQKATTLVRSASSPSSSPSARSSSTTGTIRTRPGHTSTSGCSARSASPSTASSTGSGSASLSASTRPPAFLVFIAVISHDFADGLNTVSFVLSQSGDRKQATKWLRIDAIAPLLGAIVGSLASVPDETLGYILCLYSGFFLYMGATDLLPEAHAHASWRKVGLTASGFALIFAVTRIAGV